MLYACVVNDPSNTNRPFVCGQQSFKHLQAMATIPQTRTGQYPSVAFVCDQQSYSHLQAMLLWSDILQTLTRYASVVLLVDIGSSVPLWVNNLSSRSEVPLLSQQSLLWVRIPLWVDSASLGQQSFLKVHSSFFGSTIPRLGQ